MHKKVLNQKRNTFYQITFFTGLILIIWEISIYRKTVVSIELLWLIILGIGSFATLLDFKKFKTTYDLKGWRLVLFAFMQNIISWGFLACSILVLSNYYLSDGNIIRKKHKIVETSSMSGSGSKRKRMPLVRIKYNGKMKELVFSHRFYDKIDSYNYVNISTRKGRLGWDIVVAQDLEE